MAFIILNAIIRIAQFTALGALIVFFMKAEPPAFKDLPRKFKELKELQEFDAE